MDVITVSRYTSSVVSSFTTLLELMLKGPGFDTIPMDITATGISQSTSTSSGVLKQVATPAKPQGGVGSLTNANALAGRGDFGRDETLGGLDGGLMEVVLVNGGTLLFICNITVGWGISPVATTGMGVLLCPTWHNLEPPFVWMVSLWWQWCQGHQQ